METIPSMPLQLGESIKDIEKTKMQAKNIPKEDENIGRVLSKPLISGGAISDM
jgi:hypothetical protein